MVPTEIEAYLQLISDIQSISNLVFFFCGLVFGFMLNTLFEYISGKIADLFKNRNTKGE